MSSQLTLKTIPLRIQYGTFYFLINYGFLLMVVIIKTVSFSSEAQSFQFVFCRTFVAVDVRERFAARHLTPGSDLLVGVYRPVVVHVISLVFAGFHSIIGCVHIKHVMSLAFTGSCNIIGCVENELVWSAKFPQTLVTSAGFKTISVK